MTAKYHEDPYLKKTEATVLSAFEEDDGSFVVALDGGILYPRGGGQSGDRGVIRKGGKEYRVIDTIKDALSSDNRPLCVLAEPADELEKGGLMHLMPNYAGAPDYVMCNCCECCCAVLKPAILSGRLRQLYAPSRYMATIDLEKCAGCQDCVERCFFNAIEMRLTMDSRKKKAYIINDNCMGCGSCIVGCPQGAIAFELVRPHEHIPEQLPRFTGLAMSGVSIVREDTLK